MTWLRHAARNRLQPLHPPACPWQNSYLASRSLLTQARAPVLPVHRSWFHEITLSALEMLHLATLAPFTRRLVVGTLLSNQRPGMAVLLWAATPPSSAFLNHDPEVRAVGLGRGGELSGDGRQQLLYDRSIILGPSGTKDNIL